jgi:excisionase family DNA binding protein
MSTTKDLKDFYTTGEIAVACGVSSRTVSKWIDTGMLRGWKLPLSGTRRVLREDLVQFIRDNKFPEDLVGPMLSSGGSTNGEVEEK